MNGHGRDDRNDKDNGEILRALMDVEKLCDDIDFTAWAQVQRGLVPRSEVGAYLGMTDEEIGEAEARVQRALRLYANAQQMIDGV